MALCENTLRQSGVIRNHLRSHIRSHPQRLPTAVCSNPLLPGVEFLDLLPVKSRLRMLPHSLKFHSPCVVAFLLTRGAHAQDWFRVALLRTWAENFFAANGCRTVVLDGCLTRPSADVSSFRHPPLQQWLADCGEPHLGSGHETIFFGE